MHLHRHLATRRAGLAASVVLAVALAACGSTASPSSAPTTAGATTASTAATAAATTASTTKSSGGTAVNPNQRETLPPGDIPDQIAYVPFTDPALGLRISIPEGWSRRTRAGRVTFTDKLNRVQVFTAPAAMAPTPQSIKTGELPAIRTSVHSFRLQSIATVQRNAGPAVRIVYLGDSAPDPVTGKVGTLAFERYDFFQRGREYVVLASSPKGSDNVDPWRIITNSLRFSR